MKTTLRFLFLNILFFLLAASTLEAQSLLDRAKRRAQEKLERKANEVIDRNIDRIDNVGKGKNKNNTDGKRNNGNTNEEEVRNRTNGRSSSASNNGDGGELMSEAFEKASMAIYRCGTYLLDCPMYQDISEDPSFKEVNFGPETVQALLNNTAQDGVTIRSFGVRKDKIEEAINYLASSEGQEKYNNQLEREYAQKKWYPNETLKKIATITKNLQFLQRKALPNDPNLAKITNYAMKLEGKLSGKKTATLNAVTSNAFHKQNVNKIFFTNNLNLNPANAKASDFKTSFQPGETIKAVAFFDDTYEKLYGSFGNQPAYTIASPVQHSSRQFFIESYNKARDNKKSYCDFVIVTDAANYKPAPKNSVGKQMKYLATELPPREVKMTVKFSKSNAGKGQQDVAGTFNFNADDDAGLARLEATAKSFDAKALATVGIPKAGMRNSSIEKQLIGHFNSLGWQEKFYKTVIASKSYKTLYHNISGRIIGRTLKVYMFSRKNGGCMYQDFTVKQDKTSSGYGPWRKYGVGSQTTVDCKNVR